MRMLRVLCAAMLLTVVAAPCWAQGVDSGYRVTSKIAVGGEGGWDYVTYDAATDRLFIARATRIQVVDVANGKLTAEIANTQGVHGVTLPAPSGRAAASNGRANTVLIFDWKTLAPIATVATGTKPDAILLEPFTGLVAAMDGGSNDITLVDLDKAAVVSKIALPGRPETAVSDGLGRLWVNLEDKNSIAVVDMKARQVVANWPLEGCDEPTGLALDASTHRLFSGCHNNTLVVMDSNTGRNVQKLPIGGGVDAVAFDAGQKLIFTSNGEGNLSVIRQDAADRYTALANVPTAPRARTMALDAAKHRIFTVTNLAGADGKPEFTLLVVEK